MMKFSLCLRLGLLLTISLTGCSNLPLSILTPTPKSSTTTTRHFHTPTAHFHNTHTPIPPTHIPLPSATPIPVTWLITSNEDSGPGSLRDALAQAKDGDVICFDPTVFDPQSPASILLSAPLPPLYQNHLTIDASNEGVVLDGNQLSPPADGLVIQGSGNRVMGMQIISFPGHGIVLNPGAQNNHIGGTNGQGNRISSNQNAGIAIFGPGTSSNNILGNWIGTGESGTQAAPNTTGIHINAASRNHITDNLISGNSLYGIQLCCTSETADNIIESNLIGWDFSGTAPLPNQAAGISITDGPAYNRIGPGNRISFSGQGIEIRGGLSPGNTITQNDISSNLEIDLMIWNENFSRVDPPVIVNFDISEGSVSGLACAGCQVEIFSVAEDLHQIFEGAAQAQTDGRFTFSKASGFSGLSLMATVTALDGTTSAFSIPTAGIRSIGLQKDNTAPAISLEHKTSAQLLDNRMGVYVQAQDWVDSGLADAYVYNQMGIKRVRLQMNDADTYLVNWGTSELVLNLRFDNFVTELVGYGIEPEYILTYWDKEHYQETGQILIPRFTTEDEIERYLEFVRFIVENFSDRIHNYEIFNEPAFEGSNQWIRVEDYISLTRRVIPVVRAIDPLAEFNVGSFHGWHRTYYKEYLYPILRSDLMPLVSVVSWHPFIGVYDNLECGWDFHTRYPAILEEIKAIAVQNGFEGEFAATEMVWFPKMPGSDSACTCTERTCAKYTLRGITLHLGNDITAGVGGGVPLMRNLTTLFAGAEPTSLAYQVQSESDTIKSLPFTLPDGDILLAIWSEQPIRDEDPAILTALVFDGIAASQISVIDPLMGFELPLQSHQEGENLVIEDLYLRDYPVFIQLLK